MRVPQCMAEAFCMVVFVRSAPSVQVLSVWSDLRHDLGVHIVLSAM